MSIIEEFLVFTGINNIQLPGHCGPKSMERALNHFGVYDITQWSLAWEISNPLGVAKDGSNEDQLVTVAKKHFKKVKRIGTDSYKEFKYFMKKMMKEGYVFIVSTTYGLHWELALEDKGDKIRVYDPLSRNKRGRSTTWKNFRNWIIDEECGVKYYAIGVKI